MDYAISHIARFQNKLIHNTEQREHLWVMCISWIFKKVLHLLTFTDTITPPTQIYKPGASQKYSTTFQH